MYQLLLIFSNFQRRLSRCLTSLYDVMRRSWRGQRTVAGCDRGGRWKHECHCCIRIEWHSEFTLVSHPAFWVHTWACLTDLLVQESPLCKGFQVHAYRSPPGAQDSITFEKCLKWKYCPSEPTVVHTLQQHEEVQWDSVETSCDGRKAIRKAGSSVQKNRRQGKNNLWSPLKKSERSPWMSAARSPHFFSTVFRKFRNS